MVEQTNVDDRFALIDFPCGGRPMTIEEQEELIEVKILVTCISQRVWP